jgi:N-acetyl-gamma-glutamyl-phosphate reductase
MQKAAESGGFLFCTRRIRMIKAGIVGGTGYTGVELLRLLAQHPDVELAAITSRKEAGMPVADMFPSLRGRVSLAFSTPEDAPLKSCDVVFFATPNGVAMQQTRELLDAGVKVIDLAADFRITDIAEWSRWYGMEHACPDLVAEAVYGLPEINRDKIRGARLIANPGCYPTAVQLGFLPLVEAGVVDTGWMVADCKSGVSGAGRKAEIGALFAEASDTFKAYAVPGPSALAGNPPGPEPHGRLREGNERGPDLRAPPDPADPWHPRHALRKLTKDVDLQALFEQRYANEYFVDVLPAKSHPETRSVRASNLCRIAVHRPQGGDTVVVLSVIDNLVKGAAGQAVQNMNLLFDLPENTALTQIPVMP